MKPLHWVLIGIGLFVAAGAVAVWMFLSFGTELFISQSKDALNQNEVIQQHIGEIETIELDREATRLARGINDFVFAIEGTKGEGNVTASLVTISGDEEELTGGQLVMASGETYSLFPQPSEEDP